MLDGAVYAGERRWFLTRCQIKQGRAVSSRAGDVGVRSNGAAVISAHHNCPSRPVTEASSKVTLRQYLRERSYLLNCYRHE